VGLDTAIRELYLPLRVNNGDIYLALFFQRGIISEVPQKPEECFVTQYRREIVTLAIAFPVAF
jgi:hypothetical protein